MSKIIKQVFPAKADTTFVIRKDAAVHVDWTPIVRFEASPENTKILWNNAGLSAIGIDRNSWAKEWASAIRALAGKTGHV